MDSFADRSILLVEDDDITATLEQRILERYGFAVSRARNGEEAIAASRNNPFDLVLMDIDLGSGMDGTEAAREILSHRDIPLVFLSSHTEPEVVLKTEGITSYGYIVKNSGETVLLASIKMAFRLFDSRRKEKEKEERLAHFNRVLAAIRNVNQLILREKDKELLLSTAVVILIETRGFFSAWIGLYDKTGKIDYVVQAGLGDRFTPVENRLLSGSLIPCLALATETDRTVTIEDPGSYCTECPLHENYPAKSAMTIRLKHADSIYGILTVSFPHTLALDEDEKSVLEEVAGDIAFALYNIARDEARRLAEEKIAENERMYRTLLETTPEGFWYIDGEGKTVDVNNSIVKMTGYAREEIVGKSPLEFTNEENRTIFRNEIAQMPSRNHRTYEGAFMHKNGYLIPVLVNATIVLNANGDIAGSFSFMTNLSSQKKLQRELVEANHRLQESIEAKDKLFSIISHDLRSPFHAIIGFSEQISEELAAGSLENAVLFSRKIMESAMRANELLENLLQWARVQTSQIPYHPEKIRISLVADKAISHFQYSMAGKKLQIRNDIPQDLEITGDPFMQETILRNLISNAIKFSLPEGVIRLSSREEIGDVEIAIKDNGIGIPPADFDKIFALGSKVSRKGTSGEAGSGLGLILCREFVEKHGGKIRVQSQAKQGAAIYYTIPISPNI